jgi:hypothetical protein
MEYQTLNKENREAIAKRAATKENGVYTLRGVYYRVRDGKVTHYACKGEVVESCGHFDVCVGIYDYSAYNHYELAKKCLVAIN